MKVQGNRYINNPEMIKNKVEKKTTVPQNIISEDDVKISDSARKLVETARNKVSLLRGVFNIVHYILTDRSIPQFYDVSHEILILYNSLYIHINKQKMVHYWYMNGTWKNLMHDNN